MKNVVFWDVTQCGSRKTQLLQERYATIIRVTRIGELGTTLAVTSNRRTLRKNTTLKTNDYLILLYPDFDQHSGEETTTYISFLYVYF
jgi:hypothetical protein